MEKFKVISLYKSSAEQIKVVESIVEGINSEKRFQTLLGVTGSG